MIIGIDVSATAYGTGVSNYTLNLVRHLVKTDKSHSYKLFFSSLRQPLPPEIQKLAKFSHVKIYHHRLPPTLLAKVWNQFHLFPIELFIGKCDIFHTSDWTQPPTFFAKTLTTVHDLTPFLFPQWSDPLIVKTHHQKMKRALKNCRRFICVSQNTKNDLLRLFPQLDPQICPVIYEAAEDKYADFAKLPVQKRHQKISVIEKQYGLKKYILSQGTREPRKNLPNLIAAFNRYLNKHPQTKFELAISGKYGWGQDVLPYKSPKIKILGYIPEKDMVALHAAATFLAYPSFYEGFGLPVIKSMKVAVPVLTSDNSSLSEISGSAAVLVNPHSIKSIYEGIEKMLSSATFRQKLSQKATLNSQKFSWTQTALNTLNVYRQIYEYRH